MERTMDGQCESNSLQRGWVKGDEVMGVAWEPIILSKKFVSFSELAETPLKSSE